MTAPSTKLPPTPTDAFPTPTSEVQAETEAILLKHIPDSPKAPAPTLDKKSHLQFLIRHLIQGFPARYISQDASQPWLLYWTLQAFSILQVGLDPENKQKSIDRIMSWQHPDGGFCGGPGQAPHLLPTYAAVCSLAIAGRSGPGGGWDEVDRDKMYKFFMSLKQKDGSFLVARHAEVDVRGIYCMIVSAMLLGILTPELVEGTAEFVASCQTYEGGFSSASQPYFSTASGSPLLRWPRPSLGEAHGGYTFCSLASWVALQPTLDHANNRSSENKPSIDVSNLLRWLVQMQGNEIELGGFRGRTNKLVDGCYSWWCGGSFALLGALGVHNDAGGAGDHRDEEASGPYDIYEDHWSDVDDSLYNRKALQEYLLYASQHPAGGLRDKPPKAADAYHTMYCLAGLSSAQHQVTFSSTRRTEILAHWKPSTNPGPYEDFRRDLFGHTLCWVEEEHGSRIVGGYQNRVNANHPVTNLTISHTEAMMAYFYGQTLPPKKRSSRNWW
ncbi:hypothetical protein AX17_002626 [Amanita inopinata Kibby_2008]|nr:hypothetical protein AX17_002626 [Amanita inopinata Kibby_2008]